MRTFADLVAPPSASTPAALGPPAGPSAGPASAADARSTEFRPVAGGEQLQSGEKLLVEAYAAAWVVVFALVYLWVRRHRALEERTARLEHALAQAEAKRDESQAS